ncbi:hypothetical protein IJG79_02065 [Candidatus Saccharibacteria bacterium]|nr:hypothetical protein [Candidatus Saccharibacteria bacterium]
MDACLTNATFYDGRKTRRYYKLSSNAKQSQAEVEYLPIDKVPTTQSSFLTNGRARHMESPNFVIDGIRNRIRLSLGARIIIVFGSSVLALISMLTFGKYKT